MEGFIILKKDEKNIFYRESDLPIFRQFQCARGLTGNGN